MTEPLHEVEILWLAENCYHKEASLKEHAYRDYYQIYLWQKQAIPAETRRGTACDGTPQGA
jgi:hypothetical protein